VTYSDPEKKAQPRDENPGEDLSIETPAEPVYAEAMPAAGDAAPAEPPSPVQARPPLRWLDLVSLLALYLVAGAVFYALAFGFGSALLGTSPAALRESPTAYVAVVAVGQLLLWASMLVFLFLMIRSRSTAPFWKALGWRGFPAAAGRPALVMSYALSGAALAIIIQTASYYIGVPSSVPMAELFRDRPSVLIMMALGILVAPLAEETLFRGCVYGVAERSLGVPAAVVLTGAIFGLFHSPQLGFAWPQVMLVSIVGIVLTYVRARTGTVLASYFVHLGYNTLLFAAFYFATSGLQNIPHP
jgi:membrane protease YdiL (CAAX protease family)